MQTSSRTKGHREDNPQSSTLLSGRETWVQSYDIIEIKLHAGLNTINFHLYSQPSYSSGVDTGVGVRTEKKSFKTLADIFICVSKARGNLRKVSSSGKVRAIIKFQARPDSAVSSPILEDWHNTNGRLFPNIQPLWPQIFHSKSTQSVPSIIWLYFQDS